MKLHGQSVKLLRRLNRSFRNLLGTFLASSSPSPHNSGAIDWILNIPIEELFYDINRSIAQKVFMFGGKSKTGVRWRQDESSSATTFRSLSSSSPGELWMMMIKTDTTRSSSNRSLRIIVCDTRDIPFGCPSHRCLSSGLPRRWSTYLRPLECHKLRLERRLSAPREDCADKAPPRPSTAALARHSGVVKVDKL